ncbi:MAG: hypothetical protein OXF41_05160 [bacterium]|nr:hypothetical protein [bacterium]
MATPGQPTDHQCDHPHIPLRDTLRIRRIVARVGIVGQATAVILLLYGTAPLAASLYSRWVLGQPIPGGGEWVWPHVMPLVTVICYPAGLLISWVTRIRPCACHPVP